MSTKSNIMKLLKRRKTGMTSFDLDEKLPEVTWKTIRNTLGAMIKEGTVEHDNYQYLHADRYVTAYRAI